MGLVAIGTNHANTTVAMPEQASLNRSTAQPLIASDASHQKQHNDDDENQSKSAAGAVSPIAAVRP